MKKYLLIFIASMMVIGIVRMITGYNDGNIPVNVVIGLIMTAITAMAIKIYKLIKSKIGRRPTS